MLVRVCEVEQGKVSMVMLAYLELFESFMVCFVLVVDELVSLYSVLAYLFEG